MYIKKCNQMLFDILLEDFVNDAEVTDGSISCYIVNWFILFVGRRYAIGLIDIAYNKTEVIY